MNPEISVVIPTVDEAENLPKTLRSLESNSVSVEIIVVDASTGEATSAVAKSHGVDTILNQPQTGRAAQMNLGAREARAPVLLFLHADTRLPQSALDRVVSSLDSDGRVAGGAFHRRFHSDSVFLATTARIAGWRSRHLGFFLGDQAIFVRKAIFKRLGGFDESLALCEDLDFSRRLRSAGKTVTLGPPIVSSARRFEARGPLRTTLSDLRHAWRYFRRS